MSLFTSIKKFAAIALMAIASLIPAAGQVNYPVQVKHKPYVYAQDYMKLDGYVNWSATVTASSNVVTCASCHFLTQAKVGQAVYATNGSPYGYFYQLTSVVILPEGTISSIDSDTQIHTSLNATISSTVDSTHTGGVLIWGTIDDTAAASAWAATVNGCTHLKFPATNMNGDGPAIALFHKAEFNTATAANMGTLATCSLASEGNRKGVGLSGEAMGGTILIPTPNFDESTCTFGASQHACFFSVADSLELQNIVLWGGANSSVGANMAVSSVTSGSPAVYHYTLTSGPAPHVGDPVSVTGFVTHTTNNGSFTISALAAGTFSVVNVAAITETHAAVATGTFSNLVAFEINPKAIINSSTSGNNNIANVTIIGWGADSALQTNGIGYGIKFDGGSADNITNLMEDGAGRIGCSILPPYTVNGLRCVDNGSVNLAIEAGGSGAVFSYGGTYGSTAQIGGGDCGVSTFNTFYSFGDLIGDTLPNNNGICVGYRNPGGISLHHNSNAYLNGTVINVSGTGSIGASTCGSQDVPDCGADTGNLFLQNTSITGVLKGLSNLGNIRDQGGNSFAGTTPYGGGGGNYQDVTSAAQTGGLVSCAATSGGGSGATCAFGGDSQNTGGQLVLTTGTSAGSTGTITLTFAGSPIGGNPPACTLTLDNSGTAAWGNGAVVFVQTPTTSTVLVTWVNNVLVTNTTLLTALTASKTYKIGYMCYPK